MRLTSYWPVFFAIAALNYKNWREEFHSLAVSTTYIEKEIEKNSLFSLCT